MSDSASCRILVVSPTAARAHQFVQRVQALSAALHGSPPTAHTTSEGTDAAQEPRAPQTSVSTGADPLAPGSSTSIPWTIVNKYYTADVHFETHEFEHFRVIHAVGVPAIIYVWGPGEPYREHVPEIAQKVQHYDPEVSLAVRFGEAAPTPSPSPPGVDDDNLDEFLSTHGFEFVEGERAYRRPTQDAGRHSDDEDSGIPGLPRVIDALSTIMWPSIVQSEATRQRKSRARDLIGWALEEEGDDGLRALIPGKPAAVAETEAEASGATSKASKRKSRMQREMEELERWLEDEESGSGLKYSRNNKDGKVSEAGERLPESTKQAEEDAAASVWVTNASVSSAEDWEDMLTPPTIRTPRGDAFPSIPSPSRDDDDDDGSDAATEHGFEDDFADFVSATGPHAHTGAHLHPDPTRPLEVRYDDAGRLTPAHTGMQAYRSLGSVSDFGADDSMSVANLSVDAGAYGALPDDDDDLDLDAEDDPELPSRAEILETSRKLFGAAAFTPVPEPEGPPGHSSGAPPGPKGTQTASADSSLDADESDAEESFAEFDLSRVFSALQGMKDEIAGMGDEDERRRAAARVALGLVYGLGVGDKPGRAEEAGAA